ncbi:MAG TPA: ribulose-phosphate 3-epimerase [Acidimicrobiales bacterium]|nr:ribulose-phosphate 3-epimerase [Acidimicrobiales bacterium]
MPEPSPYNRESSTGAVRVAPSILSADFAQLGEDIDRVRSQADVLHVDIMDGHFVPNLTIGPPVVKWVRRHSDLYLDCHLMMDNPGRFLGAFKDAGANGCTIHVEIGGTGNLIKQMRDLGLDVGLALNPETPFESCEPWLDQVDLLLVMTVHPGFGGQSFMGEVVPKISRARQAVDARGLGVELEVDGGIDPMTAPAVARAGARLLVAGSAIFGHDDPVAAAGEIREAANGALAGAGQTAGAQPEGW